MHNIYISPTLLFKPLYLVCRNICVNLVSPDRACTAHVQSGRSWCCDPHVENLCSVVLVPDTPIVCMRVCVRACMHACAHGQVTADRKYRVFILNLVGFLPASWIVSRFHPRCVQVSPFQRKQGSNVISSRRKHLLGILSLLRVPEEATPRLTETPPGCDNADGKLSDLPYTLGDTNIWVKWL